MHLNKIGNDKEVKKSGKADKARPELSTAAPTSWKTMHRGKKGKKIKEWQSGFFLEEYKA
ncbi:MAG: hypothetical protein Tsb0015_10450 [Simkaniaceae bacterium]